MCKASQLLIIVVALILLVGAGGCGLKLVTQPNGGAVTPNLPTTTSNNTVSQQIGGRDVASKWVTDNAPTYKFDGENLQFMQSVSSKCADAMLYEFTFDARNGGYGNRINEALDGVKTAHTIRITIQKDTVTSAITDSRYDEMTGQFGELTEDTATETKCL